MSDEVKQEFPPRKPPLEEFMESIEWMLGEGTKRKLDLIEKHKQQLEQIDRSIVDNTQLLADLKELMTLKEATLTAKKEE